MSIVGNLGQYDWHHNDWNVFKNRFIQFCIVNDIVTPDRKKALLLQALSETSYLLLVDLLVPDDPTSPLITLDSILTTFDEHFTTKPAVFALRHDFYMANMAEGEKISEWAARVCHLATTCKFGAHLDVHLRDKFIMGLSQEKIRDRLFLEDAEKLTFKEAIILAKSVEAAQSSAQSRSAHQQVTVKEELYRAQKMKEKCKVCGYKNHCTADCKFKTYTCNICNKVGHLASVCKMKQQSRLTKRNGDVLESHFAELMLHHADERDQLIVKPITADISINNVIFKAEVDSGSSSCFFPKPLLSKYLSNVQYSKTSHLIEYYTKEVVQPLGSVNLNVSFKGQNKAVKFLVMKRGDQIILGRDFMNMFDIKFIGLHHSSFSLKQNNSELTQELINRFATVFSTNLGTYKHGKMFLKLKDNFVKSENYLLV